MRIATLLMFSVFVAAMFFSVSSDAGAHGPMMSFDEAISARGTMQYLEDRALGNELHEEMEGLMAKMMSGDLSEAEADRLLSFMNKYPGPMSMMMNRMSQRGAGAGQWGMMGWGGTFGGWNGVF